MRRASIMTARAVHCSRFGWIVSWSDGAYTFEVSEEDARTCEKFPTLCHPDAVEPPVMAMLGEVARGALLVLARARKPRARD